MVNNHKKYVKEALEKQVDRKYEMHSKQLNDKFNGFDYKRPDGTTARVIMHDTRASKKMSQNDILEIHDHLRYAFIKNVEMKYMLIYLQRASIQS
ncbi:hypothetical protein VQ056_23250 [Paenibacillus sp. JTLBN-2024]